MGSLLSLGLSSDVVTLSPFDERSAAWDIARDVTSPAQALQVAANHIPEESGSNRFFSDAARDLLSGAMLSLSELAPLRWTYRDLILSGTSRTRLEAVFERTERGRDLIESYFAEERTLANILATLRTRLAPFEPVAAAWSRAKRSVSLREWAEGEFVLVLGNDESARAAIDAINRVIFERLSELLLAQGESERRRSWFFLDEVGEAGPLSGLTRLMNKGRSKGVCVVLGVQELSSLREVYGENGAAIIAANANNKVLLRVESPESADWASRMIGEYEQVDIMRAKSTGGRLGLSPLSLTRSEQLVRGSAVLPSEFFSIPVTNRKNGLTGYFLSPHFGAFRAVVPAEVIDGWVPQEVRTELHFVARPERDQYLEPWGKRDLTRLSLKECRAARKEGAWAPEEEFSDEELLH